jgi:hypothetical protein
MPFKFEWQFKYRDESSVNAPRPAHRHEIKKRSFAKG